MLTYCRVFAGRMVTSSRQLPLLTSDVSNRKKYRNRSVTYRRITTDAGHWLAMCARTLDESFDNGDHALSWSDTRQTGNDVTSSCMTSSAEFPVSSRLRRRRGIPPAWRYSLPSTITASTSSSRRHITGALPITASISGDDSEPASGVGRRRPAHCRCIATGSRNVTESGPTVRPTCLRYSYWLTLGVTAGEFSGGGHQLRTHFRLHSSEINNDAREPASRRVSSSRNGPLATNVDDEESVLRRHLSFCHVTGSRASEHVIYSSLSHSETHCRRHTTHSDNGTRRTVRLNPDDIRDERIDSRPRSGSDFVVDRSRDVVEGQRRLSLSKIGDSGLGTSIHSEQTSPDETGIVDHHHQQQQQRLSDNDDDDDDDDETSDVRKCQHKCRTERESEDVQCYVDNDVADDRTKLTRHKCEYTPWTAAFTC